MNRVRRLSQLQNGYTLLETMMVVAIMGVVTAMAMFQIGTARSSYKSDSAMRSVISQLNTAREISIAQRRNVQVTFTSGNVVTLIRQNVPSGTTTLAAIPIEGGAQFGLTTGVTADTPDAFGNGGAVWFGGASGTNIFFTTDGTLINAAGAPINGTVFLNIPNQVRTTRAVTVLGATGRIRGYRWDGTAWVRG